MRFNWQSIAIGAASLFIIGAFHPIVIKCEYYFSSRVWPAFLAAGLVLLAAASQTGGMVSVLLALVGVACLWSIGELREQERRVSRGWFPRGPGHIAKENDREADKQA